MTNAPQRILIHPLGSLCGTAIMPPVFLHLNRIWPDAEKGMLTNFSVASVVMPAQAVLEDETFVSRYFSYPAKPRSSGGLARIGRMAA
jgi:heptosyltransferase-3